MELATALIWTLRIVLPIILFCIYFKFQTPKDDANAGPTGQNYSRGLLLSHRRAPGVPNAPVPPQLESIKIKDQNQAPELFGTPAGRGPRNPAQRREPAGPGPPRERREKREGREERKAREDRRAEQQSEQPAAKVVPEVVEEASPTQEKMHLESLLNYVAFNRQDQQRTFLADEAPPPPPPRAKPTTPGETAIASATLSLTGATVGKANSEAQMVLRGAINFKRADVANNIFKQLSESQVEITAKTFSLIIRACVLAADLRSASDFLMKMETAGFTPETELLDQVMDLYSEKKTQEREEQEKQVLQVVTSPLDDVLAAAQFQDMFEVPRAKLSSTANVFVPSFVPPPPPRTGEGSPAPAEHTPLQAAPEAEADSQRTTLTASAKPFNPSFGQSSLKLTASARPFVPAFGPDYSWQESSGGWDDTGAEKKTESKTDDKAKKGKSEGKGKNKSAEKGKSDEGANKKGKGKGKKDGAQTGGKDQVSSQEERKAAKGATSAKEKESKGAGKAGAKKKAKG